MYADRRNPEGFKPGSLAIALAVNGVALGALWLAAPHVLKVPVDPPLKTYSVPTDPPPPELRTPPEPHPSTASAHPVEAPIPIVTLPLQSAPVATTPDPAPIPSAGAGIGGVSVDPAPTASPAPVLVEAMVDPRYAADLQPAYPADERRAGREGRVVVRVLVGVDGRVKQVERVSATSDAFFRATQERATSRWRFRPATRDGIPVETWRTMALRFVLQE
ncbi:MULTISPECIES: TonB family protein [unclassified Sphingomonas]|uniref:TonB family protein n=1 Tax=unclassified Sphingomonas TaxID=196159 RepID=UPI001F5AEBB8|nr:MULTISPECIES: TonB family protein [unclassified Sphingomonas]